MKKILLGIGIFLSVIIGTVALIWFFPGIILTQDRVQSLVKSQFGELFTEFPSHLEFHLKPFGFNGKRLYLDTNRLCLKNPEGCFEKVHVEVAFQWIGLTRFRVKELGPIEIINESLLIRSSVEEKKPEEKKESSGSWTDYVVIPKSLKLASLKVVSPKIEIRSRDSSIFGDMNLSGENLQDIRLLAHAKNDSGLKASAEIQTMFAEGHRSPFHAKVSAKDGWSVEGNLDGEIQWDTMDLDLTGNVKASDFVTWISSIELKDLRLKRDRNLSVDTKVVVRLEPRLSFTERPSALPKASYFTTIRGELDLIETVKDDESTYDYTLKLGPNLEKGLSVNALLKGTLPFPKGEEYRFGLRDLFVELSVPEFQSLVKSFRNTNSAIPAPFSALHGAIVLAVGQAAKPISQDRVPISLKTTLNSPEQTIQTTSEGAITFKKGLKNISVEGKTELTSIRLTLPEIDPLVPQPALKRDSRIKSLVEIEKAEKTKKKAAVQAKVREESGSSFDLQWSVDSKPSSVQVYYSIFRPFVPVDIHLKLQNGQAEGKITVDPLDIRYLGRDARVNYFNYLLGKNVTSTYEGELVIEKTDYTIFITAFEKEGKPKVEFSSEPPLEESDIISVLLFNQTADELSPDESNSVSNTQSAVANRALGLFSVWALSSTPIEAVSYNAASGVYAARVKLGAGLTATVGTDWERTQEVALRKRIGKNFVLSTIFGQDGETDSRSTKTLLEWFRRF